MAEYDSLSSCTGIENNLILTSSVYSSFKVTKDDALWVTSLSLPVRIIRPYCFKPERPVELEASFSSETEEVHNHPGKKWRDNTTIVLQTYKW